MTTSTIADTPRVFKFDLTKLSRRWSALQAVSLIAFFFALHNISGSAIEIGKYIFVVQARSEVDFYSVGVGTIVFLASVWVLRETWINTATILRKNLRRLRLMYRVLVVFYSIMLILFSFLALIYAAEDAPRSGVSDKDIATFVILAFSAAIILFSCIFALRQVKFLLRGGGKELSSFMSELYKFEEDNRPSVPNETRWLVRLDRPAGAFWIVAGIVLFISGAWVYDFVNSQVIEQFANRSGERIPAQLSQMGTAMELFGAFCLLKGRSYFLPTAEAVLALDARAPVLYLRSFLDEKPNYYEMTAGLRFFDRSIEMKLAKYFNSFGPFVAIGSQRDKVPKLGAIRLMRSDQDWRSEVTSLMASSHAIVAAVGLTPWIKWELSEIVARNYTSKTLFLFPVMTRFGFRIRRKRRKQQAERIEVLTEIMPADVRSQDFELKKKEVLLAYVSNAGRKVAIVCRKPSSNAQFLAAILAHYFLMSSEQQHEEFSVARSAVAVNG
jgi:hypothetical protein